MRIIRKKECQLAYSVYMDLTPCVRLILIIIIIIAHLDYCVP